LPHQGQTNEEVRSGLALMWELCYVYSSKKTEAQHKKTDRKDFLSNTINHLCKMFLMHTLLGSFQFTHYIELY